MIHVRRRSPRWAIVYSGTSGARYTGPPAKFATVYMPEPGDHDAERHVRQPPVQDQPGAHDDDRGDPPAVVPLAVLRRDVIRDDQAEHGEHERDGDVEPNPPPRRSGLHRVSTLRRDRLAHIRSPTHRGATSADVRRRPRRETAPVTRPASNDLTAATVELLQLMIRNAVRQRRHPEVGRGDPQRRRHRAGRVGGRASRSSGTSRRPGGHRSSPGSRAPIRPRRRCA